MNVDEFLQNPSIEIVSSQILEHLKTATGEERQGLFEKASELLSITVNEQDDAISITEFCGENLVLSANIKEKKVFIHSVDFFLDELGELMMRKKGDE